jgi:hypothetical protein
MLRKPLTSIPSTRKIAGYILETHADELFRYEWCGDSSYQQSGYAQLTENIAGYNIPIFFSETGCNTVPPRTFADQAAIFGPDMAPYWSGSVSVFLSAVLQSARLTFVRRSSTNGLKRPTTMESSITARG